MKRFLSLFMALLLLICSCFSAVAEDSGAPSQGGNGGPADMGTPPEKPDGDYSGGPADLGTPPEKPDGDHSGGLGGGPGDAPGGKQSRAEGQLGSWSMGGTDAGSIDGDD